MIGFYQTLIDGEKEKSKFEQLYILYRQDMYKTAFSIVKDQYAAEDCVHEAFLKVIKNLQKIPRIDCPQTHAFLIIIVKNLALKYYHSVHDIPDEEFSEELAADDTDIEEEIITDIEVSAVKSVLDKLPDEYYNILYLDKYMGMSIRDISESLGISYEAAKKKLSRAKARFNKIAKERLENDR